MNADLLKFVDIESIMKPDAIFANKNFILQLSTRSKLFQDKKYVLLAMQHGIYDLCRFDEFTSDKDVVIPCVVNNYDDNATEISDTLLNNCEFIKELLYKLDFADFMKFSVIMDECDYDTTPIVLEIYIECFKKRGFEKIYDNNLLDIRLKYTKQNHDLIIELLQYMERPADLMEFLLENPLFEVDDFILDWCRTTKGFDVDDKLNIPINMHDELANKLLNIEPMFIPNIQATKQETINRYLTLYPAGFRYLRESAQNSISIDLAITIVKADIRNYEHLPDSIKSNPKLFSALCGTDNPVVGAIRNGVIKITDLNQETVDKLFPKPNPLTNIDDEELMLQVCKQDPRMIERLGHKLKSNSEFLRKLL